MRTTLDFDPGLRRQALAETMGLETLLASEARTRLKALFRRRPGVERVPRRRSVRAAA